MSRLKTLVHTVTAFCTRYPAVLSGYVIYGYLFISIIRLFLKVKMGEVTIGEIYDIFSALPFMWLLALSLVKVIEVRSRLHDSERQRLLDHQELQIKETQLATMKEVVRGLQHHVNNPLAIIALSAGRIRKMVPKDEPVDDYAEEIETSYKRIASALAGFSSALSYEVEKGGEVIGNIARPLRAKEEFSLLHDHQCSLPPIVETQLDLASHA